MITTGMIPGRWHRLMQQNGQDHALAGHCEHGSYFGLVADGCGSKHQVESATFPSHNEVGSKLLCAYAGSWLQKELNDSIALTELIERLYEACLTFLGQLADALGEIGDPTRGNFIATYLLTTLVGFVVTPAEACFFWLGDGYLLHNDAIHALGSDNQPDYLAYRLFSPRLTDLSAQQRFHVRAIERSELIQVGVATDGWTPELLARIGRDVAGLKLQRWMNIQARQSREFEDDGAIALCVLP